MTELKIFSPATIANISCGFDVLGLALDTVGDELTVRKVAKMGIVIKKITGAKLPFDTYKNVAGVAGFALLNAYNKEVGFEIEINKLIKPGSGIGSSAASAAGTVWAMNELLGKPFSIKELVSFAMEGEKLASGSAHADNVAPALFGGLTLVRSYDPLDIIKIPTPPELYVTVVHPFIEVKTSKARKMLSKTVSLTDAVKQWGNVGGLVSGLYTNDYDLISRSLVDYIVEPVRSVLIPKFYEVKQACLNSGALGCGISGSGPSIFAFSKGENYAVNVASAMQEIYNEIGIKFDVYVSKINTKGIKILESN